MPPHPLLQRPQFLLGVDFEAQVARGLGLGFLLRGREGVLGADVEGVGGGAKGEPGEVGSRGGGLGESEGGGVEEAGEGEGVRWDLEVDVVEVGDEVGR